ncbi:hypothetical protein [Nonomuraea wenchangensis]|uniref:hypothetical protein n=1 Tax=Nonomuraea wenchangensis TaxID=568860 RepID=UPI003325F74F
MIAAALLEIVWASALAGSDGFTRPDPAAVGVIAAALAAILILGESASAARLVCLLLILIGVVGLRLLEG